MKKYTGIILIALALLLGYLGITKFTNSGKSIDLMGIELSAENNEQKSTAYIFLGFSLVSAMGGMYLIGKKDS